MPRGLPAFVNGLVPRETDLQHLWIRLKLSPTNTPNETTKTSTEGEDSESVVETPRTKSTTTCIYRARITCNTKTMSSTLNYRDFELNIELQRLRAQH